MIEQHLYLEILELFDLIKEEPLFKKYQQLENELINNHELQVLITKYNDLNDEQNKIGYLSYQKEIEEKKVKIKKQLESEKLYQEYLETYDLCNDYLINISKIIFKDIVLVNEGVCDGCL